MIIYYVLLKKSMNNGLFTYSYYGNHKPLSDKFDEHIRPITESLDVLGNLMEREKDAKMHKAYENALRAMRNEITLHEIGDENTVKCGNCATYFDERERLALESYADMVEYCGGPVCEACGNIWRRMGGTF